MKIKKIKEVYQCEFCGKWYLLKWRAINHEKKCRCNPDNKVKCLNCKNITFCNEKWVCSVDNMFLSINPKYDNQKKVCTPLNKCEEYNGL